MDELLEVGVEVLVLGDEVLRADVQAVAPVVRGVRGLVDLLLAGVNR